MAKTINPKVTITEGKTIQTIWTGIASYRRAWLAPSRQSIRPPFGVQDRIFELAASAIAPGLDRLSLGPNPRHTTS